MAEPNEPGGPGQSDQPERESTADDRAADSEAQDVDAQDVEDLDVADEEITERVRGGRRAISIPYGY